MPESENWRERAEAAEAELVKVQEGRDTDRRILEGFREAAEAENVRLLAEKDIWHLDVERLARQVADLSAENESLRREQSSLEAALDAVQGEWTRTGRVSNTNILAARAALAKEPQTCPKCGNELHGYRGPLCRYCTPGESWE